MSKETVSKAKPPVRRDSDPAVTPELLEDIVGRILRAGSPLKIVLFGSRAEGTASPDSDIDILVIDEPGSDCRDREIAYWDALRGVFPEYEIVACTMQDVASWQAVPNHLVSRALSHGKTLYEDKRRLPKYCQGEGDESQKQGSLIVCEGSIPKTQADLAEDWFSKGDSDLESGRAIAAHTTRFDTACFHAQQAIEKYFKGFLSLHGFTWTKTHNLDVLRWQCCQIAKFPDIEQLPLDRITPYCTARYKYGFPPPREAAEEALSAAEQVRIAILAAAPPECRPPD